MGFYLLVGEVVGSVIGTQSAMLWSTGTSLGDDIGPNKNIHTDRGTQPTESIAGAEEMEDYFSVRVVEQW